MTQISPMTLEDIPFILEIERDSHADPWSEGSFLEESGKAHSTILVARGMGRLGSGEEPGGTEAGGEISSGAANGTTLTAREILGYICFWIVADEIQILNLTVHPIHRRMGIGRMLLRHALSLGARHGARVAVLEVRSGNAAARRLYESVGFKTVGERPDFYAKVKEAAILMDLALDDDRLGIPKDEGPVRYKDS